jgi:hybrid cluster-associated redox disulfide protein
MAKITEETKINEMLKKYPETKEVVKKYKLDCFGCLGAEQESVRNAAWSHGLDLERLVKDLNKAI